MRTMTSTDAQQSFGDLIMTAQAQPVAVTRHGKNIIWVMSDREYRNMKETSLRAAIIEGLQSGEPTPLYMDDIRAKARKRVGLKS